MSKGKKKLKKGQNFFGVQSKGWICKSIKFWNFFCFLGSIGGENLYTLIFFFLDHKGQKGQKKATTLKVCHTAAQTLKIWCCYIKSSIYKCQNMICDLPLTVDRFKGKNLVCGSWYLRLQNIVKSDSLGVDMSNWYSYKFEFELQFDILSML